jgi:hypothetical protein
MFSPETAPFRPETAPFRPETAPINSHIPENKGRFPPEL